MLHNISILKFDLRVREGELVERVLLRYIYSIDLLMCASLFQNVEPKTVGIKAAPQRTTPCDACTELSRNGLGGRQGHTTSEPRETANIVSLPNSLINYQ